MFASRDEPCVEPRPRPVTGTTLTNEGDGERDVPLTGTTVEAIGEYPSKNEPRGI